MKLVLVDPNPELCEAWENFFDGQNNVEVSNAGFEALDDYDCMTAAGNSYGHMGGGVDLAIRNHFGQQLEDRVQRYINEQWRGYQPVGTSLIVPTEDEAHPWLAYTPTMEVPMNIADTNNVYLAMWGLLNAVTNFNVPSDLGETPIETVACPGLGTATGGMNLSTAARQMLDAWTRFHWQLANA